MAIIAYGWESFIISKRNHISILVNVFGEFSIGIHLERSRMSGGDQGTRKVCREMKCFQGISGSKEGRRQYVHTVDAFQGKN